ncbi:hypothetical protein Droror1_Dr00025253 [Drosera rotundifolia]
MAGGERKFPAMYTKHIKQKRKVYQDGYLLVSNNKVMLYDDSDKLLESKFLKKDEAVKTGESLAFTSYLVDIGDPEDSHRPLSNFNSQFQLEDTRITKRVEQLRGNDSTNRNCIRERKKVPVFSTSPSQTIIKEFKKNEMLKYGMQKSPPTVARPVVKEWQVLYTTQLTQKAKKYHDGTIQVVTCGSQGRQLKLFDSDKILLESRLLEKAEVIESDESLRLTAHLVDVGGPVVKHEHPVELTESNASVSTEAATVLPNSECRGFISDDFLADASVSTGGHKQETFEDSSRLGNLAVEKQKSGERLPASKPLRDTCGILSNLRKLVATESGPNMMVAPAEQCLALPSKMVTELDTENKDLIAMGHTLDPGNELSCTLQANNDNESSKEDISRKKCCTRNILEPIQNHTDISCKVKLEKNHDNGAGMIPGGRASVDLPSGFTRASKLKMAKNAECTPRVTATRRPPLVAVTMQSTSVDNGESFKSPCTRDRRDSLPLKSVNNGGCGQRLTKFTEAGLGSAEDKGFDCLKNLRHECFAIRDIRDADENITVETRQPARIVECPSFDLGF